MNLPTKKELVILGIIAVSATISWLWLLDTGDIASAILVLLAGLSGISGTLFLVGLIGSHYKGER
jgi:hypothetical protein